MKKCTMLTVIFIVKICFTTTLQTRVSDIVFREANLSDLEELYKVDREVTYEYFLPLYKNQALFSDKDPSFYFEQELERDKELFADCVNGNAKAKLFIAYNEVTKCILGFVLMSEESDAATITIELLLILKEFRKKGIGRKLVYYGINSFPNAQQCWVYPLNFSSDAHFFYQSIGFVNRGIPSIDKTTIYGISYKDIYYHFTCETNKIRKMYRI